MESLQDKLRKLCVERELLLLQGRTEQKQNRNRTEQNGCHYDVVVVMRGRGNVRLM